MKTTRRASPSRPSSPRQLFLSLVFILCAFVLSAAAHPILNAGADDQLVATNLTVDRGHGSPQPVEPGARTLAQKVRAAEAAAKRPSQP